MAFLNLDGHHINVESITHVAEGEGGCCTVTFSNGACTVYDGENAAAVLKAVGAKHGKVEHKAESHGHAKGH